MTESVAVRILDREFTVGCKPEEREALEAAAQLLDARMRGLRGDHRMAAFDRIAVLAALNLAAEVNAFRREIDVRDTDLHRGIADLNRKVEVLLAAHAER